MDNTVIKVVKVAQEPFKPDLVQDIIDNFLSDGHIEMAEWSCGNYQRLDLDNDKYEGYLSPHGIEIFSYISDSKLEEKTKGNQKIDLERHLCDTISRMSTDFGEETRRLQMF